MMIIGDWRLEPSSMMIIGDFRLVPDFMGQTSKVSETFEVFSAFSNLKSKI